ncbi:peptidylprolyl isomerase [Sphingomonas flavalba]|uniref:peptidylprolyl isomerase n=1 Tax=Sphingomonas flavalba TaxID=2559804 RepID=UPI0039E1CF91
MRAALAAMPLMIAATAALAQTVGDDAGLPQTGLNLPTDVSIFEKEDPAIRKPTAIINGEIITRTDIDQRLAVVVAANGGRVRPDEVDRLRLQVLRNMIDETLQIQEARANDIEVTSKEVNDSYARVSQNFKRTPEQMDEYLRSVGSSAASLKRQITGELAWQRLLRRRVEPFVNIGDEEVQAIMDRLEASKGTSEFRVGEIYMAAAPEARQQIFQNQEQIIEQIRQGGSFAAYARQYSQASTAAVGGDLGWVRAEQLPEPLASTVQQLQMGQIAGPIEVPGGFSILYLMDQRQVLTADPRDAVLSLRQLSITFPAGVKQADADARAAKFIEATRDIKGCGAAGTIGQEIGAEVVDNDQVRVRDLPQPLQEPLLRLSIGEATAPFGSVSDGVRILVLCGRDDPQVASGPSRDQIMSQLEEERVNRRAQRYLRDLRRDAVVDYR